MIGAVTVFSCAIDSGDCTVATLWISATVAVWSWGACYDAIPLALEL